MILVHEDKEAIECEQTDHTPSIIGVREKVQEEPRVQKMWHDI